MYINYSIIKYHKINIKNNDINKLILHKFNYLKKKLFVKKFNENFNKFEKSIVLIKNKFYYKKQYKYSLLRSPHVNKKSQEHFLYEIFKKKNKITTNKEFFLNKKSTETLNKNIYKLYLYNTNKDNLKLEVKLSKTNII